MLGLTALFMPFVAPIVLSSVYDVTLTEVRSTANGRFSSFERIGPAIAPTLGRMISVKSCLGNAILIICTSAWLSCFLFLVFAQSFMPKDITRLRSQLRLRAEAEKGG